MSHATRRAVSHTIEYGSTDGGGGTQHYVLMEDGSLWKRWVGQRGGDSWEQVAPPIPAPKEEP